MFDALWWVAVSVGLLTVGLARIVSWLLDRRDRAAVQRAKEAAIVAQACAELAASGWTAQDEAAYQSKRESIHGR
ncbi:hypothetical protein [Stenotrophomonas maltophilia]|uniref:hypothetical protein n=1 Tax=Stenotrophomonas maltophilia TaxID=40324 RepID=UPI0015DE4B66|nr:hypothetical protein [Stenotrophomonas maltophilia]